MVPPPSQKEILKKQTNKIDINVKKKRNFYFITYYEILKKCFGSLPGPCSKLKILQVWMQI